jgi:hypothetical protein
MQPSARRQGKKGAALPWHRPSLALAKHYFVLYGLPLGNMCIQVHALTGLFSHLQLHLLNLGYQGPTADAKTPGGLGAVTLGSRQHPAYDLFFGHGGNLL